MRNKKYQIIYADPPWQYNRKAGQGIAADHYPTMSLQEICDLPVGKLRVKEKGSSGGHNGIKSIISHLGDEFLRIKCGIGKPKDNTIDFVLGQFSKSEQEEVTMMIENASKCAIDIIQDIEIGKIMQKYNKK